MSGIYHFLSTDGVAVLVMFVTMILFYGGKKKFGDQEVKQTTKLVIVLGAAAVILLVPVSNWLAKGLLLAFLGLAVVDTFLFVKGNKLRNNMFLRVIAVFGLLMLVGTLHDQGQMGRNSTLFLMWILTMTFTHNVDWKKNRAAGKVGPTTTELEA